MPRLFVLVAAFIASVAYAQHGHQPMHGHFSDAERWAQVFDDPARDQWQKPDEVITALALLVLGILWMRKIVNIDV